MIQCFLKELSIETTNTVESIQTYGQVNPIDRCFRKFQTLETNSFMPWNKRFHAYTPGGATDLQARLSALVAQDPKYFGQPIVILNKPGAGGMTGWNWIMERGSKDGLTMHTKYVL